MTRVELHFRQIERAQDALGTPAGQLRAAVTMNIVAGSRRWVGVTALVSSSAYGTRPEDLEVTEPADYDGPMHAQRFRDAVHRFYRRNVGSASGSRLLSDGPMFVAAKTLNANTVATFEVDAGG